MKYPYLILAILGFVAPNILVFQESLDTGNILLYAKPAATINAMFANRISTIFMIDLLVTLFVFFVWSYSARSAMGMKRIGLVWLLTMLFGLAGGLPLFLFLKEKTASGQG